ncbi:MAG: tetratricopeptide repeat protein [Anaerolineae bacterium]|nr:tetratricopeptide repeat protein [Anaerolineae bacterium]
MDHLLLTTKLFIPPLRPNWVHRPHLVDRMEDGITLGHRFILISAPAGFGKSTLISEWIHTTKRSAAWLSLDEGDNDPGQCIRYLIAALHQIDSSIGQAILPLLTSPQVPPITSLITTLINDLAACDNDLALVLDDYHRITNPTIHESLWFFVEHLPPNMAVVVSTREDPPFPLSRLRARGQMTEIREQNLRFSVDETAAFFDQATGLRLSNAVLIALKQRTEGWIAGLQLAALALEETYQRQHEQDVEAFVATFTGSDRYVMDYLIEEVLERQPESIRAFLYQTSILDTLTASLCDAVTGRNDSQSVLDYLQSANLFLIPLDNRREWYRYHHLFAELLRTTLDPDEQEHLHQRVMHWYHTTGHARRAIHHALAYARLSGDFSQAERFIQEAADEIMLTGNILTVQEWLQALPEDRVRTNPELAINRGWILALTNDLDGAETYADAAEVAVTQYAAPHDVLGKLALLRCTLAMSHRHYHETTRLASAALEHLGDSTSPWRIYALWMLAEAQERTRAITDAIATYRTVRQLSRETDISFFSTVVETFLAAALNNHGQRQEAIMICEQSRQRWSQGREHSLLSPLLSWLAYFYYEGGDLEQAHALAEKALESSKKLALGPLLLLSYGVLALILDAEGDSVAAFDALHATETLMDQPAFSEVGWILARKANMHLRQGDLPAALRWAETHALSLEDQPDYLKIEMNLTFGRLLLAQDRFDDAREWLTRMDHFTRDRQLYRWTITTQILLALLETRSGDHDAACDALFRAVQLAAPGGYSQAFLEEDRRILALLPDVRHAAPEFVDRVLVAATRPASKHGATAQPLIDPLSVRELEVLALVADGLANRAIAQHLFITVGTVKGHVNHIYGKLNVHSRTQAVARARTFGILDD